MCRARHLAALEEGFHRSSGPNPQIRRLGHRRLVNAGIEVQMFEHRHVLEIEDLNREFTRLHEGVPDTADRQAVGTKAKESDLPSNNPRFRLLEETSFLETVEGLYPDHPLYEFYEWRYPLTIVEQSLDSGSYGLDTILGHLNTTSP
jgi:hypothetical protein